jgi:mannosyltransferase
MGLRFYRLDGLSLWEDEIFTATRAPWPPAELIAWTAGDVHPPLYYLLIHGLLALGKSDWLLRWPSALFGVLSLALVYRLGRELFGRTAAIAGMALLALSPFALRYDQEARMHALFMFLSLLSIFCLVKAMRAGGRTWWAAFALVTALNLYTIYFAFLVLGMEALWVGLTLVFLPRRRERIAHYALRFTFYSLTALALYLPWWPSFLAFVGRNLPGATTLAAGPLRSTGSPVELLLRMLAQFAPGLTVLYLTPLFGFGVAKSWREGGREEALLLLVMVVLSPLLPPLLGSRHSFYVRYLIYALPLFLLGVGQGLIVAEEGAREVERRLSGCSRNYSWSVLLCTLIVFVLSFFLATYYHLPKTDWKGVGAYLAAHAAPGDLVATDPLWDMRRFLGYYYDGPAEVLPAAELTGLKEIPTGQIWWLSRFPPGMGGEYTTLEFPGLYLTFKQTSEVSQTSEVYTKAIAFLQQAVQKAPDWVARSTAEEVMTPDLDTTLAMAHLALGDAYHGAGRLAEAIAEYKAATAALPAWVDGYLVLATACEEAGRWQEAARAYERILQLRPDWAGPHAQVAQEFAARRQWAEAAAEYKAAVQAATSAEGGQEFLLPAAEALPVTARPGHLTYGGRVRLLAYELDKEVLHPGDTLQVTLYWQVLAPIEGNYQVFVHLFGRQHTAIGQVNAFPVGGRYPTDRWREGDVIRDTYQVRLSDGAATPAVASLDVGFYDRVTMQTVPAADPAGQSAPTTIARLKLVPPAWPTAEDARPVAFRFGQAIALVGYDLEIAQDALEVTLYWRAEEPPGRPYTVFVHLLDGNGRLISQHDGPPDGGEYPTDFWAAGELIADRHRLPLGAGEIIPGEYRLAVGLYRPDSGVRLPVSGPGEHSADAAYLGW